MLECRQSQIQQFFIIQGQITGCSGQITSIIELIRDIMDIYIVTKFDADWFLFADARV